MIDTYKYYIIAFLIAGGFSYISLIIDHSISALFKKHYCTSFGDIIFSATLGICILAIIIKIAI